MLAHLEQLQMVLTGILTFAEKKHSAKIDQQTTVCREPQPGPTAHVCRERKEF
jgi:hypothetical protein